jgi:hypothetical protein
MKKTAPFLFLLLFFIGCRKEKSIESGDKNPVFIGSNCRISQVLTVDSLTGIGFEAHNAFFDAAGKPTAAELYDSLSNSIYFLSIFTYSGDTVFLSTSEYVINDAATGRVKEYQGLDDPSDPFSDTIRVTFSYNASGYLSKTEYYLLGDPEPLLRSTYTYSNGNLTKSLMERLVPSAEVMIDASLEYNTAQPVNGFMYIFPDGFLTSPYHLSFDFGKRPANTLKKVTTKFYNGGIVTDSLVTNYKNYKLSRDNYVLELFAEGDYQDGIGIVDGRTKFSYYCK